MQTIRKAAIGGVLAIAALGGGALGAALMLMPPRYELNSLGRRLMSRMSWYFVMAQNPGPSGSSCQCTGSLARSHAYWSHGWPWAYDDVETRSITGWAVVVMARALTR